MRNTATPEDISGIIESMVKDVGYGPEKLDYVVGSGGGPINLRAQQTPSEVVEFMQDVLTILGDERELALEVGLGQGGNHLILREYFRQVVTVELLQANVEAFLLGLSKSRRKGSTVVWGNSGNQLTKVVVGRTLGKRKADLLFVDGEHRLETCELDWLNYEPFVRIGGIVAFHDTRGIAGPDVFVQMLETGSHQLLAEPLKVKRIENSSLGISYYVKEIEIVR